ncbi:hypothetical protein [Oceanirhabdus sp. W0125-5]|uniref:hypothetical protein n=1 Tax=Oceanirhabdus sp. W0125-5 TaxID=2999116 RepID=UPI0022F2E5DE|nr:hypothetical protein [Oceanirhabdus sp. W0125-5]WBW99193.1 hypothetical protein OW730_10725 [Oceanirhabdus sp. W0125-5]
MKKLLKLSSISLILFATLLLAACGEKNDKDISYSWGENLSSVVQKLNHKNIKYYLEEDDKSALIRVKASDIGVDRYLQDKVFYFSKSLIIEEESVEFEESRLILVADSVAGEKFDKEMAKKEIAKLTQKYGEPDEKPEDTDDISGYTWNEENQIISTEYYKEHELFRVSTRLNAEERKNIKDKEEKTIILSSGENVEYKWGESTEELIKEFQKENVKYYIGEQANIEVINLALGGKNIFNATSAKSFYFSDTFVINNEEVKFKENRLFVVTESNYLSKEEVAMKIEELTAEYGEVTSKPKEGEYTGYTWVTEDSIISTVFIEEYNLFTLSYRFKENDKVDFLKYKI